MPETIDPNKLTTVGAEAPVASDKAPDAPARMDVWEKAMGELGKKVGANMFGDDKKPAAKPEEKPSAAAPKPEEKPADGKPAAKEGDPAKPVEGDKGKKQIKVNKKAPVLPPEPVDVTKIVTEATAATTAALAKALDKKPEPVKEPELDPADAKIIGELEFMAKNDKAKAGLPKQYRDFLKVEAEYKRDWQKENPGKKFEDDDEAHKEFYENNGVDVAESDLIQARAEMAVESRLASKMAEKEKAIDEKLNTLKKEGTARELKPVIEAEQGRASHLIAKAVGDDVAEAIGDEVKWKALSEEDPIAAEAVGLGYQNTAPLVDSIVSVFGGSREFDAKNSSDLLLSQIAADLEKSVLAQPVHTRQDKDGRPFAPMAQYAQMNAADRAKHWTLGREELMTAVLDRGQVIAADFAKKQRAIVAKYGGKSGKASPAARPEEKKPEAAKPAEERHPSSAAAGAKTDTLPKNGQPQDKNFADALGSVMFRR